MRGGWRGLLRYFLRLLRNGTLEGTVESNTGFWGRKTKWRQKVTAGGDNQVLYKVVCFSVSKKMPWRSTLPLQDNVRILAYVWCGSFVQYIVLIQYFALLTCIYLS